MLGDIRFARITELLAPEYRATHLSAGLARNATTGRIIYVLLETFGASGDLKGLQALLDKDEAVSLATELLRLASQIGRDSVEGAA